MAITHSPAAHVPFWIRTAGQVIRRLPWGRYRATHAFGRLGLEPFIARLPPDLGGFEFHCDLGDAIAREVCLTGRYEPQETQLLRGLVRRGDTVVDVGANWGYFTLAAAHATGHKGGVVAFEPDPRLFDILQANIAMNAITHVSIERTAAGAASGSAAFKGYAEGSDNRGVSRIVPAGDAADFQVSVVALDDALEARGLARVRLVKMDIEGGEREALLGMRAGLRERRYEYLLIEVHPEALRARHSSMGDALQPLIEAGYVLWAIDQSPAMYRRSAQGSVAVSDLLRPYAADVTPEAWPHVLAVSPLAAAP